MVFSPRSLFLFSPLSFQLALGGEDPVTQLAKPVSATALAPVLAKALAVVAGGDRAAWSVTSQGPLCSGVMG